MDRRRVPGRGSRDAAKTNTIEFAAPEGTVKIDGETQHTWKIVRIGKVRDDGLIDEVWKSEASVQPDPYLKKSDWAKTLSE